MATRGQTHCLSRSKPGTLDLVSLSKHLYSEMITEGPDAKSYKNVQHGVRSKSYTEFTSGINNGPRGGFDVHIYYFQVRSSI